MTPKEKAEELVSRFLSLSVSHYDDMYDGIRDGIRIPLAKKCALIAVNEIIDKDGYNNDYWKEVKQELEKR
jgi:hypothetical protein